MATIHVCDRAELDLEVTPTPDGPRIAATTATGVTASFTVPIESALKLVTALTDAITESRDLGA